MRSASERAKMLNASLTDILDPPPLFRFHGVGVVLLGWQFDELLAPYYLRMHWFTVLFVPVIPLGVYLVIDEASGELTFAKKLSTSRFHRIYQGQLIRFYATVLGEVILPFLIICGLVFGLALLDVAFRSW